ncbi:MAG: hypothetical protein K6B39_08000 [Lachnospiraceae bacterium]|nr:hypothetical protein [Lachnospiraceae bacterium]MCR5087318.1 hypothetical protein [Lachnospiraceae bacterium]
MKELTAFLATSGDMSVKGIILIAVFFVGIIALSLWSVKNAAKNGAKKIRKQYADSIVEEGVFGGSLHWFITKDQLLAQRYNDVFAIYRFSDISKLGVRWDSVQRENVLFLTDESGNRVKPAEVVGGTKAARKMFGNNALAMGKDDIANLCKAILRNAPHIQVESNN